MLGLGERSANMFSLSPLTCTYRALWTQSATPELETYKSRPQWYSIRIDERWWRWTAACFYCVQLKFLKIKRELFLHRVEMKLVLLLLCLIERLYSGFQEDLW